MGYYGRGDANCYGRGDYYRGDYYRGDPGLFSFVGKAIKGLAGLAGKAFGATPVGTAVNLAGKAILPMFRGGGQPQFPQLPPPGGIVPDQPWRPDFPVYVPQGGMMQLCQIKGTHANRSSYFTKGGGTSRYPPQILYHPAGTECVRNRRMNVANPRALRRALRRTAGFAKLARRYVRISSSFKRGGRKKKR